MRAPLALGLALAVALATVYYVNVSAQDSAALINVTALHPGQNVTFTFDYVPRVVKFVGLNGNYIYRVDIYIPGADFVAATPRTSVAGSPVHHERATVWVTASQDTVEISVLRAPPSKPKAVITVAAG